MEVKLNHVKSTTYKRSDGFSGPRCPCCGNPTNISVLNTNKRNIIEGLSCLVYCQDEIGCGWIEGVSAVLPSVIRYMMRSKSKGEVFDLSKIR